MLSEVPSFNAARRYGWSLLATGLAFAVLGALLLSFALARAEYPASAGLRIPSSLGLLGLALWTAAGAFLSSALMCLARQRLLRAEGERSAHAVAAKLAAKDAAKDIAAKGRTWQQLALRTLARAKSWVHDPESIALWPPAILAALFAIAVLKGGLALWRSPEEAAFDPLTLKLIGAGLIVLAFPLLVLERLYATKPKALLPEAPQLERLLRLPLAACVALAAELILRSVGFVWTAPIQLVVGVLIVVIAVELILRCTSIVFVPFAPIEHRVSLADSRIAGAVLRLKLPSLKVLNLAVRRQLGIDLSRSWALAFIQKAALTVVALIALLAWGVTGITSLSIEQRGIYERLGRPVAVFGPGLHFHLPWPLGRIRPVEIGVVHLLPIEFLLPGGAQADKSSSVGGDENEPLAAAEAAAPMSADRLWTDDHPFEGNYLIASEEHGRQSFQLVDIDMAVMYRVGLSEEAARNAAYRVSDIDELIQAVSGQLLVRYFTHNTLLDLLGKSRESFTKQFQSALQAQLDHFSTGVEAIGVSVEAIHPPPGAADAYHNVQAAEIAATTEISLKRGEATRSLTSAQQQAAAARNDAVAGAAERLGEAQGQSVLFAGDRQAYAHGGYPFLLERWLDNLSKGLATSAFVAIDHRLTPQSLPAFDLRNLSAAGVSASLPMRSPKDKSSDTTPSPSRDEDEP